MHRHPTSTALAAVALVLAAATSTVPHATAARTTSVPVLVIGDSITYYAAPALHERRPRWIVDADRAREVGTLPWRISVDLVRYGVPRHVVIALGTNESAGWRRADYSAALSMLPRSSEVFFVTTYRDPAVFGQWRADIQERYSSWMRAIARDRADVRLINWRRDVLADPSLLVDGVHASHPAGIQRWVDLVEATVAHDCPCKGTPLL
jgi:hypothetical protein